MGNYLNATCKYNYNKEITQPQSQFGIYDIVGDGVFAET